jgi:hypothetical protein
VSGAIPTLPPRGAELVSRSEVDFAQNCVDRISGASGGATGVRRMVACVKRCERAWAVIAMAATSFGSRGVIAEKERNQKAENPRVMGGG